MARNRMFVIFGMVLALILAVSGSVSAKNVVLPTYYGYGVVSHYGGWVYPYVVHPAYGGYATPYYGPYNYYYLSGYYPYYGGSYTPVWNGYQWGYTAGGGYAVSTRGLHLRASAGKGNNVIGSLYRGETVYIYGRYGNWCLVQSAVYPAKRGYAHAKYLAAGAGVSTGWNANMNWYVPRGW